MSYDNNWDHQGLTFNMQDVPMQFGGRSQKPFSQAEKIMFNWHADGEYTDTESDEESDETSHRFSALGYDHEHGIGAAGTAHPSKNVFPRFLTPFLEAENIRTKTKFPSKKVAKKPKKAKGPKKTKTPAAKKRPARTVSQAKTIAKRKPAPKTTKKKRTMKK